MGPAADARGRTPGRGPERPRGGWTQRDEVGAPSLTCYLAQSVVFVALLASYGGGLGDDLGVGQVTGAALLTWLGTVLLAVGLARAGRRGPFEVPLRRLTHGSARPAPATRGREVGCRPAGPRARPRSATDP
jgi:uncharacterized membrane protein YeiB